MSYEDPFIERTLEFAGDALDPSVSDLLRLYGGFVTIVATPVPNETDERLSCEINRVWIEPQGETVLPDADFAACSAAITIGSLALSLQHKFGIDPLHFLQEVQEKLAKGETRANDG